MYIVCIVCIVRMYALISSNLLPSKEMAYWLLKARIIGSKMILVLRSDIRLKTGADRGRHRPVV